MGTLLSSQSMFMFTSNTAPAVPPTAIVTILLASWNRRRVFRSWKKVFQSSFGLGVSAELAVGPDVVPEAEAVLALRREANRHWKDMGFRAVVWNEMLVEIRLEGTLLAHGCRASEEKDE
jgi:hypothetical protein